MRGVEGRTDDTDGGRGMADWTAEREFAVFTVLVGLAGDALAEDGVDGFNLEGVVVGVVLVMLTLSATLCGRGLIGLETFEDGEWLYCAFFWSRFSCFSSSELLNRRRVPARTGEGGCFVSINADFGRYFGSPEDTAGTRGRSDEARVSPTLGGVGDSTGLDGCSSDNSLLAAADIRLRVIVFESGVATLFEVCGGGLVSPMEERGAAGLRLRALKRRELVSLAFFALLSGSRCSLFITSAKALPIEARPSD